MDDELHRPGWPHPEVVLRSQLGACPLALLALRGLTLPDQIFTVDAAEDAPGP